MRKELYELLCRELGAIAEIKHIDLWNRNVEFIEQEIRRKQDEKNEKGTL